VPEKDLTGLVRRGDGRIERPGPGRAQWNTGGSSSSAIFSDAAWA
jgi:hypothetical protein